MRDSPCMAHGRIDPAEEARKYLERHDLLALFQDLAATLLVQRPADPRQWLLEELQRLESSSKISNLFSDDDVRTAFGLYDKEGKGSLTPEQYCAGWSRAVSLAHRPVRSCSTYLPAQSCAQRVPQLEPMWLRLRRGTQCWRSSWPTLLLPQRAQGGSERTLLRGGKAGLLFSPSWLFFWAVLLVAISRRRGGRVTTAGLRGSSP